ncbi:MAG: aldehyde dehydrogenase [bacterium]|nr:aldehyde dehydrogenase [bacterium]
MALPHIPVLRAGKEYESLDRKELAGFADGQSLVSISQANAGIVRRDMRRSPGFEALRALTCERLLEICEEAGGHFMESSLPLNATGDSQSPDEYVAALSATSGMPHTMCRRNMSKINTVFTGMRGILRGLMRGMDPGVIDRGVGEHDGVPVSYAPTSKALGVVLPSNSPGVNSIWMPAIPLKVPVVLKPGREEPWTPMRIMRAFLAAGAPPEAFSFYPTDHEGAAAILDACGRSQLFGDAAVTAAWKGDSRVELHGPGYSKVLLGADQIGRWREHLDVLVSSVVDNGGRSCINASSIFVPSHGAEIAEALAERVAGVEPVPADDPDARLSAFANVKFADYIDGAIESGLAAGGARDLTAAHRSGPRRVELDGAVYLRPTVVHCDSPEHPLAKTEYLFPFTSVVEVPEDRMLDEIGHSLVVTAITKDQGFQDRIVASPDIDRLNLGPVPTTHVDWDQPHEGNLFETLYQRRAIRRADW